MPDTENTTEIWKPIPSYEGRYEASSFGRIRSWASRGPGANYRRSAHAKILAGGKAKGYRIVLLYRQGKRRMVTVHSIIAETFIGHRPQGYELNHKDGVKANNYADNLEYVTRKRNAEHAKQLGLYPAGIRNGTYTHPESRARGTQNGRFTHPESTPRGENHGRAKLTEADVLEIRSLASSRMHLRLIAARFKVSESAVKHVVSRRHWKHV